MYLIYYKIPRDMFSKIAGFSFLRDQHHIDFSTKCNAWIGLYGWTSKKSIVKKFKATRNMEFFKIKEVDIDKSELKDEMKDDKALKRLKLDIFPMGTIIENEECVIEFPLTKEEYELCMISKADTENSTFCEIMDELIDSSIFTNPEKFDKKVLSALASLGFVNFYIVSSDDQLSDIPEVVDLHASLTELYAYNSSYGMNINGEKLVPFHFGMFELYSLLFGKLLVEI